MEPELRLLTCYKRELGCRACCRTDVVSTKVVVNAVTAEEFLVGATTFGKVAANQMIEFMHAKLCFDPCFAC